jgi:hypothetical protein
MSAPVVVIRQTSPISKQEFQKLTEESMRLQNLHVEMLAQFAAVKKLHEQTKRQLRAAGENLKIVAAKLQENQEMKKDQLRSLANGAGLDG